MVHPTAAACGAGDLGRALRGAEALSHSKEDPPCFRVSSPTSFHQKMEGQPGLFTDERFHLQDDSWGQGDCHTLKLCEVGRKYKPFVCQFKHRAGALFLL